MKRSELKAEFMFGSHKATYTLSIPDENYHGYGNGMFSEIRTDIDGAYPEIFDERYNKKLNRNILLDAFKKYVVSNIMSRFNNVDINSLIVRDGRH